MSFVESLVVEIVGGLVAGSIVAFAAFLVLNHRFHLRERRDSQTQEALTALGFLRDELDYNSRIASPGKWPTFGLTGRERLTPVVLSVVTDKLGKDLLATYYFLARLNLGPPPRLAAKTATKS